MPKIHRRARPRLLTSPAHVIMKRPLFLGCGTSSCFINMYPDHLMCTLNERADVDTLHADGRVHMGFGQRRAGVGPPTAFNPASPLTVDPFDSNSGNLIKKLILTLHLTHRKLRLPSMVQSKKVWCNLWQYVWTYTSATIYGYETYYFCLPIFVVVTRLPVEHQSYVLLDKQMHGAVRASPMATNKFSPASVRGQEGTSMRTQMRDVAIQP